MNKRAILKVTPYSEDGTERDLFLSLQENMMPEGKQNAWHLPQQFGWGPNDMGIFARSLNQNTTVVCMDTTQSRELIRIEGVPGRGQDEFPFAPADVSRSLSGTLVVVEDNHFLSAGSYTWTLDSVTF